MRVLKVLVAFFSVVTVQSNTDAETDTCDKPDDDSCKEYNIGSNTNHYCKQVWMKMNCCNACKEAKEYFVPEITDDKTQYFCDPPCQNKGKCVGPSTCQCKRGFSGEVCEKGKGVKDDDDDKEESEGNEISDSKRMLLQRQHQRQRRQAPAARNSFVGRNNHHRDDYEDYINNYYRNYYRTADRDRGSGTWGQQYFG